MMKIFKTIVIFLLISIVCYTFYFNPSEVEIIYAKSASVKAPMALVLIVTFSLGVIFSLFFAFLAGMKFQFRTKKIEREKKQIEEHQQLIDKARSSLALGNFDEAESLFSKIIAKDPNNIGARVALSKTYLEKGDSKNALRILDEARAEDKKNPELLLAASDLNARLENYTAAYDNAAMVLKMMPKNKFALQRLSEDCLPLDRFDEATEYLRELIRLSPNNEITEFQERLAEVEFMAAAKLEDDIEFESRLKDIISRHKDFAPALLALADLELDKGNFDKAESSLLKAYALSVKNEDQGTEILEKIGKMWIKASHPKKAISTLEKIIRETEKSSKDSSAARYALGLVQLELENLEGAESALKPLLSSDNNSLNCIQLLEAKLIAKRGDKDLAFKKLVDYLEKSPCTQCH